MDTKPKSSGIEFTPEDVEANRLGEITQAQISRFQRESSAMGRWIIGCGISIVLFFCLDAISYEVWVSIVKLFLVSGISFAVMRADYNHRKSKRLREAEAEETRIKHDPFFSSRTVLHLDGKPVLGKMPTGRTSLRIHGLTMKIRPGTAAFFANPGTYRVYYLSGTGRFLSAEYLGDGLFK